MIQSVFLRASNDLPQFVIESQLSLCYWICCLCYEYHRPCCVSVYTSCEGIFVGETSLACCLTLSKLLVRVNFIEIHVQLTLSLSSARLKVL